MSAPFFLPWVGDRYRTDGLGGARVLLLGESHYGDDATYPEFTRDVVRGLGLAETKRHRFFTTPAAWLLDLPSGGHLTDEMRRDFWPRVAFYNFIQERVGAEARIGPTDDMWSRAIAPYEQIVHDLDPHLVVVLGKRLGSHVPDTGHTKVQVNHPSSGVRYDDFAGPIQVALRDAQAAARR